MYTLLSITNERICSFPHICISIVTWINKTNKIASDTSFPFLFSFQLWQHITLPSYHNNFYYHKFAHKQENFHFERADSVNYHTQVPFYFLIYKFLSKCSSHPHYGNKHGNFSWNFLSMYHKFTFVRKFIYNSTKKYLGSIHSTLFYHFSSLFCVKMSHSYV